ncbi:hypothetical protein [Spirillospora sp. NPDC048819]|uniref:DUF6924 domain-containing protein n=1 Tax=Spirillospora sp. NPDC048819 TaxID=3155268 RepID=UPI0033E1E90E
MKMLPRSGATLLVRTDFHDPEKWKALQATIDTPNEDGFMASARVLDDPAYQDLSTEQILALVPDAPGYRLLTVVDKTTVGSPEMPLLVIDLLEEPRGEIRVIATEFWSIENNLSLANMDFHEFADAVAEDGIFRGF